MKNKITLSILGMLLALMILPVVSQGQCPDGLSASPFVTNPILCNGATTGNAEAGATGGTSPYTYSWSSDGGTNATINSYYYRVTQTFSYEPAIQNFTIPAAVSQVTISISGAAGGGDQYDVGGGTGASFSGVSTVTPGHILSVVVGQMGGNANSGSDANGGGGGASWVYDSAGAISSTPHTGTPNLSSLLIVAAGGGGAGYQGAIGGAGGTDLVDNSATSGQNNNTTGGTGGNGGVVGAAGGGAGGGGWISNGGNATSIGIGGKDWANSFVSAAGQTGGYGGFGSGGGGYNGGGGGGGGYNGGGGGNAGVIGGAAGGGGSYFNTAYGTLPGSVTATNTGNGSVTISYLLQNPSGLTAGTYSVTVTDNNGCSTTASITLTQPGVLRDSISSVTELCSGGSTGSATVGVKYGTSPYTFSWTNGSTTATIGGLSAGTYTVTVQDSCGGAATASVTISQAGALSVIASISNTCAGGSNGNAEAFPSGGSSTYTYSWSTGATTAATGSVLSAGTYTVTVQDNCGTSASTTVVMSSSALQDSIISASTVNIRCNGESSGAAEVGVIGGVSPYTYSWSEGGGTNAIINSYYISGAQTFSYEPAIQNFTVPVGITQVSITVTGAAGGQYEGTPGGSGASFTGVSAVTPGHILSVVVGELGGSTNNFAAGGGGASWVYDSTLTGAHTGTPALSALLAVAAGGGGDGHTTNDLGGAGGTNLTTNSTSSTTTNGHAGSSAGGTGGNGGAGGQAYSASGPPYGASSAGGAGGAGWISNGGTYNAGPLGFGGNDWANNFTSAPGFQISYGGFGGGGGGIENGGGGGGGYNGGGGGFTAGGAGGGGGGGSFFNTAYGSLPTNVTATNTGNGSVTISYSAVSSVGLKAGTYSVTVTDQNGCAVTASVTLTQPNALATSASATAASCNGQSTGIATASPSNGTSPYTYSWSGGGGTNAIGSGLSAGTFTVTVNDNCGAAATASVIITQPNALTTTASATSATCYGIPASASASPSNGTSPYTYSWAPNGGSGSTASLNLSGASAGTFTVTINDVCGATATATVTITQPAPLTTGAVLISNSCNGSSNGNAFASPSGGTTPYTYSWSNGYTSNPTGATLSEGSYRVTVHDNCGASAMASITIKQYAALTATAFTAGNISCNGGSNGMAKVSISGGSAPYTYSWSPNTSSAYIASGLSTGTYTITVSDQCGTTASSSTMITQPALLKDSVIISYPLCTGGTGGATIGVTGGTSPYKYTWSPNISSAASATGLSVRSYAVQVKDNNGCYSNLDFSISQPAALRDSIIRSSIVNVSCGGTNSGSATVGVKYGIVPYTYSWSPAGGNSATATGLSGGTYTVMVSDGGGCTVTASVNITQPGVLTPTAFIGTGITCNGSSNGMAKVSVSGGSSPYTYSWNPVSSSTYVASGLSAGTYSVTVQDNCGTSASSSVTITQPVILSDSVITSSVVNPPCRGGGTGSATVGVTGGTSPYNYKWSPNVSTTATATGLTVRNYVVQVKDAKGCYNNITVDVTCSDSSISDAAYKTGAASCCSSSDNINLYPNPNTGQFTLSGLQQGMILEMYDYTGKMISRMTTTNESMQLNILNQANGVYLIRILDKDGNLISEKKVVKTQ